MMQRVFQFHNKHTTNWWKIAIFYFLSFVALIFLSAILDLIVGPTLKTFLWLGLIPYFIAKREYDKSAARKDAQAIADQTFGKMEETLNRLVGSDQFFAGWSALSRYTSPSSGNVLLQAEESIGYQFSATLFDEVAGPTRSSSASVRIRLAKGISVGRAETVVRKTKQLQPVAFGDIALTNKRIIFLSKKQSFEIKLSNLLSYEIDQDELTICDQRGRTRLFSITPSASITLPYLIRPAVKNVHHGIKQKPQRTSGSSEAHSNSRLIQIDTQADPD